MNEFQASNVLDWVKTLLFGEYKHGNVQCYDADSDTYTSIGVAMELFGLPITKEDCFQNLMNWKHGTWFSDTFGLKRTAYTLSAIDYYSSDYFAVAALLLGYVPSSSATVRRRKEELNNRLLALVFKENKSAKR